MGPAASPLSYFTRGAARAVAFLTVAHALAGQDPARPYEQWRTLGTPHFRFHYPPEYEAWTHDVASHMEAVDSAVARLVGFTPGGPVDVVVDNPFDLPNGSALPMLDAPVLTFWPVPPDPRADIGNWRSWGEMLSAHEFAHLAHLMRPSRNPVDRLFWSLMPTDLGPLPLKLPRWAIEGYATYIEGKVTGSGRPNGAWRAAILRQWALEGALPTYDQMSSWGAFNGGDFAYLAGSAFFEWLTVQYGDSTLPHVWRRASARVDRTFDDAFTGVFGDPPRVLYGRFVVRLTAQALDARSAIGAQGLVQGAVIQHLDWGTGDPAFSRDGSRVAIVLRSATGPARTVVWPSALPAPDTAAARRGREMLARDPEDVPATQFYPEPRKPIATLSAVAGQAFVEPRFLDDTHVLVNRLTRQADGTMRPDLYVWEVARGVRRVTYDAGLQDADPAPDGRSAIATRCAAGSCDVVRVNLNTGSVSTLAGGTPRRSYFRPRYAPDGRRFVVSVSVDGHWALFVGDQDGHSLRPVFPNDSVNRYDATFTPSGDTLVYATDGSGVTDLAGTSLRRPAEFMLTRVTGAAVAPAVDPATGVIWFLDLHARGYDVRGLPPRSPPADRVDIIGRFGAAAPPRPAAAAPLPAAPVGAPVPYGLGPRQTRVLPGESYGADGFAANLTASNVDVIGRLTALAGGSWGARTQSNGAMAALAWRGSRVELDAGAHWARQEPSLGSASGVTGNALDDTRSGGLVAAAFDAGGDGRQWRARAGAGVERLSLSDFTNDLTRSVVFAEWAGSAEQSSGRRAIVERLAVHGDVGRTGDDDVRRFVARAGLAATGFGPLPAAILVTYGRMAGSGNPLERFAAGGLASPLVDSSLTAARVPLSALPNGSVLPDSAGSRSALLAYRASIPLGVLAPYYEGVSESAGDRFDHWHRALGAEIRLRVSGLAQLFVPGLEVRLGVARSLDAPYAGRTTLYSAVRYTP